MTAINYFHENEPYDISYHMTPNEVMLYNYNQCLAQSSLDHH